MRPEGVVLPTPAFSQALSLSHSGEKLGVQELILEFAVERFSKVALPRVSRIDASRGGAVVLAPAPESMGDELGAVVRPDELWCRVEAGEVLQQRHHVIGLAAPTHSDGQAKAAALVDHLQELEPAAISRGVELEVHGPDLVGMLGPMTPHRAVRGSCPLLLSRVGTLETFLPPEPVHPLVVHQPALSPQQAVGHQPVPADVLGRDLPEATPELGLLDLDNLAAMGLGTAVLATTPQANRSENRNRVRKASTTLRSLSGLRSFPRHTGKEMAGKGPEPARDSRQPLPGGPRRCRPRRRLLIRPGSRLIRGQPFLGGGRKAGIRAPGRPQ